MAGMFDVFGEVKKHISTSGQRRPKVTSGVLSMMKLAMLVTIFSCVLVTARQYIGQNINCITGFVKQEHKAIENYCFISGTFTIPVLEEEESAHPGVGPLPIKLKKESSENSEDSYTLHAYYQWVPIVLALQAALYYLPDLLWKQVDHGFFETALCNLNAVHINENDADQHIKASANYVTRTMKQHSRYAISFLFVEIFGVFIAILNLFLTNAFLGGEFFSFGPAAVKYLQSPAYDFNNPLNEVFPKVGKCTWYKYGPTGTIQVHDAMCVLPLNIVNEKTYICLWVVYITTAVVTSIILIYHTIMFLIRGIRERLLLRLPMKSLTRNRLEIILKKGNLGDWFLIYNFKQNMVYFAEWVKMVHDQLII
ncbi:UNVERIFIED_CONTAM: hypothetical protein RMT77_000898 [Armadillidium vulgare]